MRYFTIALIIIMLPVNLLMAQKEYKQGDVVFVKPVSENLRLSPNGTVISMLPQGTKLAVLGQQGNWVAVQLVGWIWSPSLAEKKESIAGYTMRALHILVKTETEANEIKTLLTQKPDDFEKLAKERSIGPNAKRGGDLGVINKGDLLQELDKALHKLKPGEISGVLKSELGYHIFKRLK
jgi:parvulin-like peptidyl-prolyl isomerase